MKMEVDTRLKFIDPQGDRRHRFTVTNITFTIKG